MEDKIKEFRDGIFALNTRRFGTVAELMIEELYDLRPARKLYYDRYDDENEKRIEIKFSRALIKNEKEITKKNVLKQCIKSANIKTRALKSTETDQKFDCNIQQIKTDQFDILYYGIFFTDCIKIFKMTSKQVQKCKGYSNKQHKGNEGEGQFHLNNKTYDDHCDKYFEQSLKYEELYKLFDK